MSTCGKIAVEEITTRIEKAHYIFKSKSESKIKKIQVERISVYYVTVHIIAHSGFVIERGSPFFFLKHIFFYFF